MFLKSTLTTTCFLALLVTGGGTGVPSLDARMSRVEIIQRATETHPYSKELADLVVSTLGEKAPWGRYRDPDDGRRYVGHDACVPCHYDRHADWSETKMADQAIRTLADFRGGLFLNDSRCLSCHATGFDPGRDNGGFDEGVGELVNVQCEACHGAGSLMVEKMDREFILRTNDAALCGKCHSERYGTKLCFPDYDEWKVSGHGGSLDTLRKSPLAEGKCLPCHSADGVSPPGDRPPTLDEAAFGVTCTACHDPMARTFPDLVDNNQLRRPKSELCQWCHSTREEVPQGTPHSPQAEMFAGRGGEHFPGQDYRSGKMNAEMERGCLTCHALSDRTGEIPYQGHTFMANILACRRCHPDLETFDRKGVQTGIRDLLRILKGKLDQTVPGEREGEVYRKALYNYQFVLKDRSLGVHNSDYARKLLVDSTRFLSEGGTPPR